MLLKYFPGFIGLLVCLAALPLVKRLARSFNLYDAPGPLKIHQGAIPRLGGIAMFAGLLAGCATLYSSVSWSILLPVTSIFALVWTVGLVDDLRSLGASFRFAIQIAAGASLWFAGWRLEWFRSPALDLAATCMFVAFVVNAMNLLDGMDGLAASLSTVSCVGFLIISAGKDDALETAVTCSLLGACVGVLSVNAPPAEMFMGDSGSTLIGIVLAFLSLNWIHGQAQPQNILIPLMLLGVPLADAILAILRRARTGQGLFAGDRRHFYDILLQRGWTVESVLKFSIGISGALALAGWLCARGIAGTVTTVFVIVCGLATGAFLLGSLQPDVTSVPTSQPEAPIGPVIE
jgi:UDP-GlcNAc:undecaprenyl-phosphate GlcNAc-1-phosphate transferase